MSDTAFQALCMILRGLEPVFLELTLIAPEFIPEYCTNWGWGADYAVLICP